MISAAFFMLLESGLHWRRAVRESFRAGGFRSDPGGDAMTAVGVRAGPVLLRCDILSASGSTLRPRVSVESLDRGHTRQERQP